MPSRRERSNAPHEAPGNRRMAGQHERFHAPHHRTPHARAKHEPPGDHHVTGRDERYRPPDRGTGANTREATT